MAETTSTPDEEIRQYVQEHRDDLVYAIKHGDRYVRSICIAALICGGDAELELAKREIEQAQEKLRERQFDDD